jgi:hypothetical protein
MLKSTMKTEIRVSPNGFEVWYSTDGGQKLHFHKRFESMDDAVKETVSLRNSVKFLRMFGQM